MKKIIYAVLMVSITIMGALGWRVIHTTTMSGIDHIKFTVYGDSRYVECSGNDAGIVIRDMLDREPDLEVDSEWRTYENGDVLAWKIDYTTGDREFWYRVANTATFFPGKEFTWTVKGAGPCPLESL